MSGSSLTRPYRGVAAEDRVASRREALIDAALEVFTEEGWSALSARRVCQQAGLTRRYFYESFDDMDALIGATFDRITGEVNVAVRTAVGDGDGPLPELVRLAVSAALDVVAQAPWKGRFLAVVQNAGGSIAPHRTRAREGLAEIVELVLSQQGEATLPIGSHDARIAAQVVVGATLSIANSWVAQEIDISEVEIVSLNTKVALGIIEAVLTRER
jgi:AcrR family transcriptional regulator